MMAAHSEKGPSSSSRWIHCTPSAKLCAEMPDQATGYAEQGTQAHSLCEFLVKEAMGVKGERPVSEEAALHYRYGEAPR